MKRARVGAFTDFGGLRYRNPVQIFPHFPDFHVFSAFSGLVYYTGTLPGVGLNFDFNLGKVAAGTGVFWR